MFERRNEKKKWQKRETRKQTWIHNAQMNDQTKKRDKRKKTKEGVQVIAE